MILAAGFGKRVHPLTVNLPKPLLQIGHETLLSNTLKFLEQFGIEQVVINVHFLGEKIIDYINKKKFKVNITFVEEKDKILNPVWHIHRGSPPQEKIIMPFSMLLNIKRAVRKVGPAINILVPGSKIHCSTANTLAIKVLPQPRPHTHIEKFLFIKPLRVISWKGASFMPVSSSVVNPKLALRNLAKDILASLLSRSPLSFASSALTSVWSNSYFSGQYHIIIYLNRKLAVGLFVYVSHR